MKLSNIALKLGIGISLSMLPFFVKADTTTGTFNVDATVTSDYGLYDSTGQQQAIPVNFPAGLTTADLAQSGASVGVQGTIGVNSYSQELYYKLTDVNGAYGGQQFSMKNGSSDQLGYNISYKDCNSTSQGPNITSNVILGPLSGAQTSLVQGSGGGTYCSAYNTGTGHDGTQTGYGWFVFAIPPTPNVSSGSYSDSVTITVCTTSTCT